MSELSPSSAHRYASPTLGTYLARRYTAVLLFTLVILGAFVSLMDALELIRRLARHHVSTATILQMSVFKLPDLLLKLLPFVILISTLALLRQLTRRHEITVLRAAGLPTWRLLLGPLAVVALGGAVALFIVNPLAATMLKRYTAWEDAVLPGATRGLVTAGGTIWLKQREQDHDFFITAREALASGRQLKHATVFMFAPSGDFQARLDAAAMELFPGTWRLSDVTILTPNRQTRHEPAVSIPTDLTPQLIQNSFHPAGTLTIWELGRFIRVLRQSGFPSTAHEMQYQRLWAMPFLLAVMFWLAVPWGLRNVRGRSVWPLVAAGLGLGFGFYLLNNVFTTFGLAGRLDVTLAAWAPLLIAALAATALLLAWREE
jgi:lipopolysaccharide export system permease protein